MGVILEITDYPFSKNDFFPPPKKMNPENVNLSNLKTLSPIKKQIKGRTDVTVPFRIQKDDEKEEKALIKFTGIMKVFERDGIFSLGINVSEDEKNLFNLEKIIEQKAKEIKPSISNLLPKFKFSSEDFQLIKENEFSTKIWAKMYNDRVSSIPQTNFLMIHEKEDGKMKKGRRIPIHELIGT